MVSITRNYKHNCIRTKYRFFYEIRSTIVFDLVPLLSSGDIIYNRRETIGLSVDPRIANCGGLLPAHYKFFWIYKTLFVSLLFLLYISYLFIMAVKDVNEDGKPTVNSNGVPLFKTKMTKRDEILDNEIVYEFGGPVGALGMMLGFPCLMYYFWICLEYHQGKLITPASYTKEGLVQFLTEEIIAKIMLGAFPTLIAVKIYMGHVLYSAIAAYFMPGPVVEGLPLPSLKGGKVSLFIGFSAFFFFFFFCV